MDGSKKQISKALTTSDIRAQAQNWKLAGDVGLLLHLEQFSEDILSKAHDTQTELNDLLNSFEETSVVISNVTNQFLALQNSQFVENRVYDDETPTEEKKIEEKVVDQKEQDKLMFTCYKEAVEVGIKLLDTHFEQVQLPPSSDSDEEDHSSGNSALVWRSKNPYADKPFPLLIGSAEWWADDNVGLGEYEENIDSEKVLSESDSDMETDRNVEKRVRMSSTSSSETESTTNNKKPKFPESSSAYDNMFMPVKAEIFDDDDDDSTLFGKKEDNLFGEPENIFGPQSSLGAEIKTNLLFPKPNKIESDEEEMGKTEDAFSQKNEVDPLFSDGNESSKPSADMPPSVKPQTNAFSKELAAKLGSVANKQSFPQKRLVNDPLAADPKSNESSALFDDKEDDDFLTSGKNPPLFKKPVSFLDDNESDEQLFGGGSGLFSGSKNIFEEDNFSSTPKQSTNEASQVVPEKSPPKIVTVQSENLFEGDLFADVEDEDALFSTKPANPRIKIGISVAFNDNSFPVKASTPKEVLSNVHLNVTDDLFGISDIVNTNESASNATDGSLNAAHLFDDERSKDLGFGDQTVDESSRNVSTKSPANDWFQPTLSSTRRTFQETSDYKTHRISSDCDTNTKSESLSGPLPPKDPKNKMSQSAKSQVGDKTKQPSLFPDDEDEIFSSNIMPKSSNTKDSQSLFDDDASNDDLFSSSKVKKANQTSLEKKTESGGLFSKTEGGLFEDEDNSLFTETSKPKDTVSISSSRSSLFDEVSVGKSTLQSVFEKDKSMKSVDDLFGSANNNTFTKKIPQPISEDQNDDLFGESNFKQPSKDTKSLFGNAEDSDDLFTFTKKESLFADGLDDDDLFGKSSKSQKQNIVQKSVSEVKDNSDSVRKPTSILNNEKNLFNDVDDEDDLFISGSSKEKEVKKEELSADKVVSNDERDSAFEKRDTNPSIQDHKVIESEESHSKLFPKNTSGILFEDDKDEDLFSSTLKVEKKGLPPITKENEIIIRTANVKEIPEKPKDILTQDPLMSNSDTKKSSNLSKNDKSLKNSVRFKPEVIPRAAKSDPLDIFDEQLDEKLFSGESVKKAPDPVKRNTIGHDVLFAEKSPPKFSEKSSQKVFSSEVEKPSPPKSLDIKKNFNFSGKGEKALERDEGVVSAVKPKKVGKLNIPGNLNINPAALLPGAKIRKDVLSDKVDDGKTTNLDEPVVMPSNLLTCTNKDRVKIQAPRRPQSRRARQEALRSSGINFGLEEELIDSNDKLKLSLSPDEQPLSLKNSPVVPSPTQGKKDITIGQEDPLLVKNIDISPAAHENIDSAENSGSIFHSIENSPETLFSSPLPSNPMSPSTDEEDYFNVPELDVNFEKEDQSIFKSNLKDPKKDDDNLLFDGAPVISPLEPSKDLMKPQEKSSKKSFGASKVGVLFSDSALDKVQTKHPENIFEEEDDGLFSSFNTVSLFSKSDTKEPTDSIFSEKKVSKLSSNTEAPVKSLFGGESDETDDLFNKDPKPIVVNKFTKPRIPKASATKSNLEKFTDPLGLMSNPE